MKLRKRERQQMILGEFQVSPSVRLGELAERYNVTKETIRRDIDELSAQGLLARTYGGAVASFMNHEPGLRERSQVNPEGRRRMANAAAGLIMDSGILMIDTGSTMEHVSERLAALVPRSGEVELTAITNSLRNATILGGNPSIRVVICPGDYDDRESAAFGPQTLEFIGRFNAEVVIMSAGGIDGQMVTDANSEAVAVKRAMIRQANHSVLVMEERKFNFPQFEMVCSLAEISDLVTDGPLPAETVAGMMSTRVHVAQPPSRTADSGGLVRASGRRPDQGRSP